MSPDVPRGLEDAVGMTCASRICHILVGISSDVQLVAVATASAVAFE